MTTKVSASWDAIEDILKANGLTGRKKIGGAADRKALMQRLRDELAATGALRISEHDRWDVLPPMKAAKGKMTIESADGEPLATESE